MQQARVDLALPAAHLWRGSFANNKQFHMPDVDQLVLVVVSFLFSRGLVLRSRRFL